MPRNSCENRSISIVWAFSQSRFRSSSWRKRCRPHWRRDKISFHSCSKRTKPIQSAKRVDPARMAVRRNGRWRLSSRSIGTDMATGVTTDRQKALDAALAQIDRAFGKGSAMKLGSKEAMQIEAVSTGSLRARYRTRHRRIAARSRRGDFRTRIVGQDDAGAACDRRGAKDRRHGGVHRCRTCARSGLCQKSWASTSMS